MLSDIVDRHGKHLLRDKAREPFVDRHAQGANTAGMQAKSGSQDKIATVGFKQICGAGIGAKACRDQRNNVHQGIGRLAAFVRKAGDLLHRQNKIGVRRIVGSGHRFASAFRSDLRDETSTRVASLDTECKGKSAASTAG